MKKPLYRSTMDPQAREAQPSPLQENPLPPRKPRWKRVLWYTLGSLGGAIFLLYFYLFITA